MIMKRINLLPSSQKLLACIRYAGFWSKSSPVGKKLSEDPIASVALSPSQFVEVLALKHMPRSSGQDTTFDDTFIKTQVLLSCEKEFSRVIPDNQLGSIISLNDVIQFFGSPQQSPSNPRSLFPTLDVIRFQGELPQNLSFPEVATSVQKRPRKPFQNFDSPEHAKFLTKQQREARKKKRRHLTAWK